jgi:RNA polymerase sigma-70 factor (ECF subfamily)
MTADSDAVLVARVVTSDDRAAFELLVRRHQGPVRNFLRRLARNDPSAAEDLAQETFLKLFRSIAGYRGQSKFSTWLYRIAYRTFLDGQRRRVAQMPLDEEMLALAAPDTTLDAGNQLDVEQALLHLTPRQRAVFDLHYGKGMSHEEVAQAVDLPLGTVKSDLVRGIALLRRVLGAQEKSHG